MVRVAFAVALWSIGAGDAWAFKPDFTSGHRGVTEEVLDAASAPSPSGGAAYRFSTRAVDEVVDAVKHVDAWYDPIWGEFYNPVAHCDDEQLPACARRIATLKQEVIGALTQAEPDGEEARELFGRALHTLQDFYSHSNWIYLGRGEILDGMGRSPTPPELAAHQLCSTTAGGDPALHDTCAFTWVPKVNRDGIQIGWEPQATGERIACGRTGLTSGYADLFKGYAPPTGKCSHGLELPIGQPEAVDVSVVHTCYAFVDGIHHDLPSCPDHGAAIAAAKAATAALLDQVLTDPRIKDDEAALRAFMGARGSVAFVIDSTGSMSEEIEGVRRQVRQIISSNLDEGRVPDRYVLVRFGDPDVALLADTDDPEVVLAALDTIVANGGDDCPEVSQKALQRAIAASSPGGKVFLYTDATSKNPGLAANALAQAREKNIQVTYALTGSCSPIDPGYIRIAAETGGQWFFLQNSSAEVERLFTLVEPSLADDQESVVLVDAVRADADPATTVPVLVDGSVSRLLVALATGDDSSNTVSMVVRDPSGAVVSGPVSGSGEVTVTSLLGGDVLRVDEPQAGPWSVEVSGDGAFTLHAQVNSPVAFSSFDFVIPQGRPGHEGYLPILGQPLLGSQQVGIARVAGDPASVQFELRDGTGAVLQSVALAPAPAEVGGVDAWTGTFELPEQRFRLYATGVLADGTRFERLFSQSFLGQTVLVEAEELEDVVLAGTTFTALFRVTNLGEAASFRVTASDDLGFVTRSTPATVDLGPGETDLVLVEVDVPASAPEGESLVLTAVAVDAADEERRNETLVRRLIDVDSDGDGVSDRVESGAFGDDRAFDGNGDGIPDIEQATVASFLTYDRAGYVTVSVQAPASLVDVGPIAPPEGVAPAPGTTLPGGYFSVGVDGLGAGASHEVTVHLPGVTAWLSYGPTATDPTPTLGALGGAGAGAVQRDDALVVTAIDGGGGDVDLAADARLTLVGAAAATNARPDVRGGEDQTVPEGELVTLVGEVSEPDGQEVRWFWSVRSGAEVALDDPSALTVTFVAPEVDEDTELTFVLEAVDALGASRKDQVTVTVVDQGSAAGEEDAGCGCRLAGGSGAPGTWMVLVGLAVGLGRRRVASRTSPRAGVVGRRSLR